MEAHNLVEHSKPDNRECPKSAKKKRPRNTKLEKFRNDKHATAIQSLWRGCNTRSNMKKLSPSQSTQDTCELVDGGDSFSDTPATPTTTVEQKGDHTDGIAPPDNSIESFEWSESKHESFDSVCDGESAWPDLDNADPSEVRQWVCTHKKVLVRAVTWNMEAKKPPPVEDLRRHLLPLNRCGDISVSVTCPYSRQRGDMVHLSSPCSTPLMHLPLIPGVI